MNKCTVTWKIGQPANTRTDIFILTTSHISTDHCLLQDTFIIFSWQFTAAEKGNLLLLVAYLRSQTNLHSQYDPINNHGPVPSWSKFNYRTACLSSSSVPLVFLGQGKVQKNNNTVHLFFHQKLTYEHSKRHTVYFRRDFVWLLARRVVAVERYWRGYGPLSDILEEQSPHHLVCFTDTFSMLRSWTDSSVFFTCTRLEDMHQGRCSTSVHSPRPERTVMRGLTGWVVGWLLTHSVHWRMQF